MTRRFCIMFCTIAAFACFNATGVLAAGVVSVPFVPTGLNPGDTYQIAFVTSGERDATSTEIADYNAFVQTQAELAGAVTENWGVAWKAIALTLSDNAVDNAVVSAPVYLLDSSLVASGFAQMWSGFINGPIGITQFGIPVLDDVVWTGSNTDGTRFIGGELGNNAFPLAVIGNSSLANNDWIEEFGDLTSVEHRMYGLSEELTVGPGVLVVPEPTVFGTCILLSGLGTLRAFGRRRRVV